MGQDLTLTSSNREPAVRPVRPPVDGWKDCAEVVIGYVGYRARLIAHAPEWFPPSLARPFLLAEDSVFISDALRARDFEAFGLWIKRGGRPLDLDVDGAAVEVFDSGLGEGLRCVVAGAPLDYETDSALWERWLYAAARRSLRATMWLWAHARRTGPNTSGYRWHNKELRRVMYEAAKNDLSDVIEWGARAGSDVDQDLNVRRALHGAIESDLPFAMQSTRRLGATLRKSEWELAAKGGCLNALIECLAWGGAPPLGLIAAAVESDREEVFDWCAAHCAPESLAPELNAGLARAAATGRIRMVRHCLARGATAVDAAGVSAIRGGQAAAFELCCEHGFGDFTRGFVEAACRSRFDLMAVCYRRGADLDVARLELPGSRGAVVDQFRAAVALLTIPQNSRSKDGEQPA